MEAEDIKIVFHQPSIKMMPEKFEGIKNAFEVLMMERRTPKFFKEIEKRNAYENADAILGMVIGAGPSLDPVLHEIKKAQDRFLIVCVDTVFSYAVENGIVPDFVLTIDPQPLSLEHFIDHTGFPTPLIFTPTSNSRIVSGYQGKKYVVVKSGHHFLSPLENLLKNKGSTIGGGSVSCVALDLLMRFGSNPIVLSGLDCGFPWKRVYAKGSSMHVRSLLSSGKSRRVDDFHSEMIKEKKEVVVKDMFGGDILSHQNLYAYLRGIEEMIECNRDRRIINLSPKGALIRGAENLCSLREIVPLFDGSFRKGRITNTYRQEKVSPVLKDDFLRLLH